MDGESEDWDCDEVMCARWREPGGEWTVDRMKEEADSIGNGDAYHINRLVIYNGEGVHSVSSL